MAPSQTQLQQALALRKANPQLSVRDAVTQVAKPSEMNAPVAGQPPAVTPITPAPLSTNQQVLADNKAKVASEIQTGTRPEVGQQAQPIPTQNPVNIPSQLTPKDQGTIDRMTAEGRFGEQPKVAPVSPTVETQKAESKKEVKTEVVPPPITIGDMYNNLVNRIDVTPEMKALPTFKIAQNRYNKANMYSSMSPSELSSEMKSAKLVEGSPAWEDLKTMNPALVQSVKALNTVNGVKPEIFTYVNNPDGTRTKQNNLENTFVSDYEDNYGDIVDILKGIYGGDTAEEARNKIYTQDVRNAEAKATEIELKMNALSDTIAGIDKDVEKEFAGTGATGSRIALEKQYRNEQLTNQYKSLEKNYTTYANKANNLITQNTDLYKSGQEQKKQLQSALAGIATKKAEMELAKQYEKPTFQQYGDKVYQVSGNQLIDTGINTTSDQWQSANITRYNPLTGANESTPIFYKKKSGGAGFEAVDLSGNPIDANLLGGGTTGTPTGGYATVTTEMRTDRNMNPTAFTTDIAKQAGLVEGVDYVKGDKFPGSSNLYTAKLIGDPIETTIRVIDNIGFTTKSGQNRWTYTDKLGLNNDTWAKMSPTDKVTAIKKMYQQEGGNGIAIGEVQQNLQTEFTKAPEYQDYLNNGSLPTGMKAGTLAYQDWKKGYDAWKEQTNPLSTEQKSRVDKYVLDFENQPEIKDYSLIQTNVNAAKKYAQGKSNTDDQALIYSFAKVMDPNSVVRESEYATVQEYSQALLGRYLGKIGRIYSTDGFLTDDAKTKMVKTLEKKQQASKESYDSIVKQKSGQINKITGGKDGETYLTNFSVEEQAPVSPQNDIMTVVNNLVPDTYKKYFQ